MSTDDFGIKVKVRKYEERKPEQMILKFNGDEITEWDFKFLYTRGDQLSFTQIAELFEVEVDTVFRYAWYFGVRPRYGDKQVRNEIFRKEREKEEREYQKSLVDRAQQLLEKKRVSRPEKVEIQNKKYVDALQQAEYNEAYQDTVGLVEALDWEQSLSKDRKRRDPEISELRHYHLVAMRAYRKLDRFAFSKKAKMDFDHVRYYELTPSAIIPKLIERCYIETLKVSRKEIKKIKEVLAGNRDLEQEEDREIPPYVRHKVWSRDNGRCTNCGRSKHIHLHHINKYSDGGMHTIENLKLLCVVCHAEEHKEDRSYHMLKKLAEKLTGEEPA